MLQSIKPGNSLIGLMALFFVLGYTVGRADDADPAKKNALPQAAAAEAVSQPAVAVPTPVAAQPAPQPVAAPPQPVAAAPQPVAQPKPAVAVAPAPQPVVQPAPVAQPAPAAPTVEQIWRVRVSDKDAALGPKDAPLTVVMFTSFGCPKCTTFKDAPSQLKAKYGDKVRVIFKHKVIPPQSADSLPASIASLAAKEQGKFWEYADKLFTSNALDPNSLEAHAKELKLDVAKFKKDMLRSDLRGQALEDALLANEVGAHSMPNVLINGVRMSGPKEVSNMMALAESQMKAADAAVAAGTKPGELYAKSIAKGKFFEQLSTQAASFNTTGAAAIGPDDATVKIVLFEDFQCPFCATIGPKVKEFQKLFPTQVQVVFKHMPLISIHPEAQLASEAAVEAQIQGKFWELHDVFFANQKALQRPQLEAYAERVGLDIAKVKAALDGRTHKGRVDADAAEGQRNGVSSTPSIYINGRKYQGPRGYPPEGLEAVSRAYLGLK